MKFHFAEIFKENLPRGYHRGAVPIISTYHYYALRKKAARPYAVIFTRGDMGWFSSVDGYNFLREFISNSGFEVKHDLQRFLKNKFNTNGVAFIFNKEEFDYLSLTLKNNELNNLSQPTLTYHIFDWESFYEKTSI